MRLPTGIVSAVSPMLPAPEAVKPEAPPVCVAVKVTPVKTLGKMSLTAAPVTLLGPKLMTTIVYVFPKPGVYAVLLSFTVTVRSAWNVIVAVSVALLLAGLGSVTPFGAVTVAVSDTVPVADEGRVPPAT